MAKVTYNGKLGVYGELSDFYNPNKIFLSSKSAAEVVYVDQQGLEKIIFEGSNLVVNKQGLITGGTIDEIHFSLKFGPDLIYVSNFNASAKALSAAMATGGVQGVLELALSGNDTVNGSLVSDYLIGGAGKDTINGSGGEDRIKGGLGNDTLDGGVAGDTFIFKAFDGDDKILNFDAKGGGRAQDYIDTSYNTWKIVDVGNDTRIDFANGDTITLVGVDHKLVDNSDFI